MKKRFSIVLTEVYVDALDQLVNAGLYLEYQVAIRDALRLLFRRHGIEPFSQKESEKNE